MDESMEENGGVTDPSEETGGAAQNGAPEGDPDPEDGDTDTGTEDPEEGTDDDDDSGSTVPDYDEQAEEDLAVIRSVFPMFRRLSDLRKLKNVKRYGELRDAGLSAEEALAASHYDVLLLGAYDGRGHLSPSVAHAAARRVSGMGAAELASARELFPGLSDREIESLYRRASGNAKR